MNREIDKFIYITDLNYIWLYDVSKSKISRNEINCMKYLEIREQVVQETLNSME
ncbi:hypothetical protein SDC9_120511 [bioreactor metagenome]|uniref:Uncharacterized protein n=1 Tax=bioreactor metagenome TaxID=1076179 RepID=A0A645C7A8_9ZZZZ